MGGFLAWRPVTRRVTGADTEESKTGDRQQGLKEGWKVWRSVSRRLGFLVPISVFISVLSRRQNLVV